MSKSCWSWTFVLTTYSLAIIFHFEALRISVRRSLIDLSCLHWSFLNYRILIERISSTMKRALLFKNGSDVDGKVCPDFPQNLFRWLKWKTFNSSQVIKVTDSMEEFISVASERFNVPIQKIFTVEGCEIVETELIRWLSSPSISYILIKRLISCYPHCRDNEILYASAGEPFIRLQNKNPESSFPCVTGDELVTFFELVIIILRY